MGICGICEEKGFWLHFKVTACFLCQRVSFYCPTFETGSCSLHFSGANLTNNLHVSVPFLQLLQVHCCKPEYSDSLMANRAQAFVWEEMSQRCRLPRLASVTGVDPPRWSPSPPTWTEIRTWILTAGFKKNARLIAAEHVHRSNFIRNAESTSIHFGVQTPFALSLSGLHPFKRDRVTPMCGGYRGRF